jgi:general stress protein CsbA
MVSVTDGIKTKHLCVKLTFVPFARVEDSHFVSVKMHRMRHGTSSIDKYTVSTWLVQMKLETYWTTKRTILARKVRHR